MTTSSRTQRERTACDLIIENKIKKIFVVQARIDIAHHPRVLDKAEKAGFKVFLIGSSRRTTGS